ncbi:MAG: sulfatase-like hydrolase/transferase [Alphaproteobacteria bacterium]|nr:sulfatase-like hydrolase/transferase [Alphaproteobacteria bacterium]
MQADDRQRWSAGLPWAALGGAALGAADAVRVGVGHRLGLGAPGWAGLSGAAVLPSAGAALLLALLLAWRPWTRDRWTAVLLGAAPSAALLSAVTVQELPGVPEQAVLPTAAGLGLLAGIAVARLLRGLRALRVILAAVVLGAPVLAGQTGRVLLSPGVSGGADHPDLLLVTVDGLRPDRLDAPGELPSLARLAAEGTRLEALVAPGSAPDRAADDLLHARPVAGGVGDAEGLLQGLVDAGYVVGVFLPRPWDLPALAPAQVLDDDPGWPVGVGRTLLGRTLARAGVLQPARSRRADEVAARALRFLGRRGGRRAAWVHLEDPLPPYAPVAPFDVRFDPGRDPAAPGARPLGDRAAMDPGHAGALDALTDVAWVRGRYLAEVAAVDAAVGSLLAAVDAEGGSGGTLVVLAGLRGSALDDGPVWFGAGGPLRPARVDVPGVLRWPGHVPTGGRVRSPAELADLGATVRDLLGLPLGTSTAPSLRATYEDRGLARSVARAVEGPSALVRTRGAFLWWTPEGGWAARRAGTEVTAWTPARLGELVDALPGDRPAPSPAELDALRSALLPPVPAPGVFVEDP